MKNNQKGFSFVEILLVVTVIGLIGAVSWLVYDRQNNKSSNSEIKATQQADKTTTSSQLPSKEDPYEGWKTYSSKAEGFTLKYPADWNIKDTSEASREAVSFEGPNNFTLWYDVYSNPNPSFKCANCSSRVLASLEVNQSSPLYLVVESNKVSGNVDEQTLSISGWKEFKSQPIQTWSYYNSFKSANSVIRWNGAYRGTNCDGGCDIPSIGYDDFVNRTEVKTASDILRSLKY